MALRPRRRDRKLDRIAAAETEEARLRRQCREGTERYRKALETAGYLPKVAA